MSTTLCAALLSIGVLYAGLRLGVMVAGGSDPYGYVSQAGLWRRGLPIVHQSIVRQSPWPWAAETWAPLGYRPSPKLRDAIVPMYAPGLPLLMALFQAIAGYCGAFLVVPLCSALTVWLTFTLGRRLFDAPAVALWGAALVAASPVFLYQLMNAMSDVPIDRGVDARARAGRDRTAAGQRDRDERRDRDPAQSGSARRGCGGVDRDGQLSR